MTLRSTIRSVLRIAATLACGVASGAFFHPAYAQGFPAKPIRLIVPYPPGGAVDPIARTLAARLQEAWGQPVLIDNKPGAGTSLGTALLAKAEPDGHSVILASASHAVNPAIYAKLPYDPEKDFSAIGLVANLPLMLAVNPQVPVKSARELVEYLKARPGQVNFSSTGNGTMTHLSAELFQSMAGVQMQHVPYKGSAPSLAATLAGETAVIFDSAFLLAPQARAGKLRALAIAGARRTAIAPDLPALAEAGLPGYDAAFWVGFLAPAGLPREIAQKWSAEVARILRLPEVREQQIARGVDPVGGTPEEFAAYLKSEIQKWGAVARRVGIKAD